MKTRHAAIITLDTKLLLGILDYKGGKIIRVFTDDNTLEPTEIHFIIEHKDMPAVETFQPLPRVTPAYRVIKGDNGVTNRIERVNDAEPTALQL